MNSSRWESDFHAQTGVPLDCVLGKIADKAAAGRDLRGEPAFRELRRAREEDDASLPMGVWEREPRRADWRRIQSLCTKTLAEQSKDLELGVWLLDAQLHLFGFAGFAPAIWCLTRLCREYWDDLYPAAVGGDLEHRSNVLLAAGKLLVPALRTLPLARAGEASLSWHQHLLAQRNERLAAVAGGDAVAGPRLEECRRVLARTSTDDLARVRSELTQARASLDAFRQVLAERAGTQVPSLAPVAEELTEMERFLDAELCARGHPRDAARETPPVAVAAGTEPALTPTSAASDTGDPGALAIGLLRGVDPTEARAAAYAALDELANLLLRVDPHSPTPYLIKRAVSWGALSTAELFQEIFVRCEGRLSIFELMGVEAGGAPRS